MKMVNLYQHPTLQVSQMEVFADLKVGGGDLLLLGGPGSDFFQEHLPI